MVPSFDTSAIVRKFTDQAWLRREDLDALSKRLERGDVLDTARQGQRSVNLVELAEVVASYNAWTRIWNAHETNPALPLSPDWWDGTFTGGGGSNCVELTLHDGRTLHLQMKPDWWRFHDGLSCQRNEIPIASIVAAGWVPRDQ